MIYLSDYQGFFAPEYFFDFKCSASLCEDSCCKVGWEIPIDSKSLRFYRTAVADFEDNIITDSDGDIIFKQTPGGGCTYFNSDGLCELMIKTGRQCEICEKYPRFFEEYDGFTEAGLSVSCPTAARLVLLSGKKAYGEISERKTGDRLLEFLIKARAMALKMVFDEPEPDIAADKLMGYAGDLQELIEFDELPRIYEAKFLRYKCFDDVIMDRARKFIFTKTELLSNSWKELIDPKRPLLKAFAGTPLKRRAYLGYLIYRRFLKAINSEDIYTECAFIRLLYELALRLSNNFFENIRIISREIEHNAENTAAILGFLTDL